MIDIHCHLLPEVDDGAQSIAETMEMVRQAAQQGVTTIIATPHHGDGRYVNPAASVRAAVDQLNERLMRENVPVLVLPGQEIHVAGDVMKQLDQGKLLTLGNSKYILLELPPALNFNQLDEFLHELRIRDFTPVLAHPERHAKLMRDKGWLAEFVVRGGLTQVTSHSFTGRFSNRVRRNAQRLLEEGLAHFVASDAHSTTQRKCNLRQVYEMIETQYGSEVSASWKNNARSLVHNLAITSTNAPIKRRKWAWFV
jgi:protein-tyrosine phosphatase